MSCLLDLTERGVRLRSRGGFSLLDAALGLDVFSF
jgi:hypothetical protein